jgi:hypothetical protein
MHAIIVRRRGFESRSYNDPTRGPISRTGLSGGVVFPGGLNQPSDKLLKVAKHLDDYGVSPRTRVSTVDSTLSQIEASKCWRPRLETAGGWRIPDGRPPSMLVDTWFILFVPVELLLVDVRAGFMPQWRQLSYTVPEEKA